MESCYIPNNPQYGLSLEYAAYNTNYNEYPHNNDPPQQPDGVLCCGGLLQDCGPCHHLQCPDAIGGDLNGDLDDFSSRLAHYDGRLGDCEVQVGGQLDECVVDCGQRLDEECRDHLRECDRLRQLDECEQSLGCVDSLGEAGGPVGGEEDQEPVNSNCWASDDMGSFSLPPLDLDPMPNMFPFSPCSASYK